jgi:hypothetical protein
MGRLRRWHRAILLFSALLCRAVVIHFAVVWYQDVCVLRAGPSPRPVFITAGDVKSFFIRKGASTVALDVENAVAYIDRRWPKTLWQKVQNRIRLTFHGI